MDDTRLLLEIAVGVLVVLGIVWRGGEIKGVIEASLKQNTLDHAELRNGQEALWNHTRAQDEILRDHEQSIGEIKARITGHPQ